jgi:hypothetical protein
VLVDDMVDEESVGGEGEAAPVPAAAVGVGWGFER